MAKSEKEKAAMRAWYHANRERELANMRRYRERLKDEVFSAYGGYVCVCCGELEKTFLTIDHVNNDGAEHRRNIGFRGGIGIYLWLRKNHFPPGFQVLCFNCNHGKQLNGGRCPHQEINMSHSFEQSQPHHSVHDMKHPQGHGHMDQKHEKGMRSPMLSQLPMESGLESPEQAPTLQAEDGQC